LPQSDRNQHRTSVWLASFCKHTHDTLSQGTRSHFHSWELDLRVSSGHAIGGSIGVIQPNLVHRPSFVPCEVKQGVLEQAGVTCREDESVSSEPVRVEWIEAQVVLP
jgi:hypothetical protein